MSYTAAVRNAAHALIRLTSAVRAGYPAEKEKALYHEALTRISKEKQKARPRVRALILDAYQSGETIISSTRLAEETGLELALILELAPELMRPLHPGHADFWDIPSCRAVLDRQV